MRHFIFHLLVLSLLVASLGGTFTTAANASESNTINSNNIVDKISQRQNQRLETMKQKLEQRQATIAQRKEQIAQMRADFKQKKSDLRASYQNQ